MGPDDLKEYLKRKGITAEVIEVRSASTSGEAARSLGESVGSVVKSVLFVDDRGKPVLVILGGEHKLKQAEFARMTGKKKVRLATREEVARFTGYPAGGVPPVGVKDGLEVYVDAKTLRKRIAFAGGGSQSHLLKFDPSVLEMEYPGRCVDLPVVENSSGAIR